MTGSVVYDVGSWRLGDDGCIHRRGKLRYSNGDVYDGEWVNGKRHGKGTLRFGAANGSSSPPSSYIGDFHDNFFHGFGLLTVARSQHPLTKKWRAGETYEGEFRLGKKHGRGTAKTSSGDTYDGEYQHDEYHGRGVCAYRSGDMYDGQWTRGKWHGHGELRRKDGSTYVGDFVGGEFHGFGKFLFGSGGKHGFYAGDYRFGQRHGKGIREFGDGKRYEGDWREDEMEGVGMLECEAFKFVGEFARGKFHGHGVVSYASGDSYEGAFVNGDLHGDGKYVYADGGWYQGAFKASKKHGRGTRVYSTGDSYDGEWDDDTMHGRGVLTRTVKLPTKGDHAAFRYEGEFNCGEQTGVATISYAFSPCNAEELFEWTQEYEFPVGSGLWHCGKGASTYEGQVCRGVFHGEGELQSPDGKRWKGCWQNGKLHGHAQCVYLPLIHDKLMENEKLPLHVKRELMIQATGLYRIVRYDGEFDEGVRQGRGRLLYENGDWLDAQFEKGFARGVARVRFSTGRERYAEYTHGKRTRWLSEREEAEEIRVREPQEARTQDQAHRQSVLRALMA